MFVARTLYNSLFDFGLGTFLFHFSSAKMKQKSTQPYVQAGVACLRAQAGKASPNPIYIFLRTPTGRATSALISSLPLRDYLPGSLLFPKSDRQCRNLKRREDRTPFETCFERGAILPTSSLRDFCIFLYISCSFYKHVQQFKNILCFIMSVACASNDIHISPYKNYHV